MITAVLAPTVLGFVACKDNTMCPKLNNSGGIDSIDSSIATSAPFRVAVKYLACSKEQESNTSLLIKILILIQVILQQV